jgi:hypothetical protein
MKNRVRDEYWGRKQAFNGEFSLLSTNYHFYCIIQTSYCSLLVIPWKN